MKRGGVQMGRRSKFQTMMQDKMWFREADRACQEAWDPRRHGPWWMLWLRSWINVEAMDEHEQHALDAENGVSRRD